VSLLMFPCNFPRRSASPARFADAIRSYLFVLLVFFPGVFQAASAECLTRGTGDLGIVIERASGSVQILDTTEKVSLFRVEGLGDLSHASAVFSRDGRYAYVFGRDGGLSRIDLLCGKLDKRVVQAGNSIGGAISQDGSLVAVSNYTPGGIKVFAADSLELLTDLPALDASGTPSKVVGLVDAPGQRLVYTL
jgi:protein NirF